MKWISVKDRLPEKEGRYYVYVRTEYADNKISFDYEICEFDEVQGKFWTPFSWQEVLHWMPLPEPPRNQ